MNDGDSLFMGLLCASVVCVLVILADGWFVRPKRDPGGTSVEEPALPKMAGYALVSLSLAMLWRLFKYEAVDFSLMLVVVGAASGIIWALDQAFFARRRKRAAAAAGADPERVVALLNDFLTLAVTAVETKGGWVNKFLGDGFMACFGAPLSDGRDSRNAVKAVTRICSIV